MKKFTRGCLLTALVLLIMGGVFSIVGYAAGGGREIRRMTEDAILPYRIGDLRILDMKNGHVLIGIQGLENDSGWWDSWDYDGDWYDDNWFDDWYDDDWSDDWNEYGDYSDGWITDSVLKGIREHGGWMSGSNSIDLNASDVRSIEIYAGSGYFDITQTDGPAQVSQGGSTRYNYYIRDGILHVASKSLKDYGNTREDTVKLRLPDDYPLDSIHITVGGALVESGELTADAVDLYTEAGALEVKGIRAEQISAACDAGSLDLKGVETRVMDISVQAGSAEVTGIVREELNAGCSAGNLEMKMKDSISAHNYELDAYAGSIQLGSHSYDGIGQKSIYNNDNGGVFRLSCSGGYLELEFEQD